MLAYSEFSLARGLLPKGVKFITLIPCSAYMAYIFFAPEKYGGPCEMKIVSDMQNSGKGVLPASTTVCNFLRASLESGSSSFQEYHYFIGRTINVPGLPPFYDYEKAPQITAFGPHLLVHLQCQRWDSYYLCK